MPLDSAALLIRHLYQRHAILVCTVSSADGNKVQDLPYNSGFQVAARPQLLQALRSRLLGNPVHAHQPTGSAVALLCMNGAPIVPGEVDR